MKTLAQLLAYLPGRRQAKIAERSRKLIEAHRAALAERKRRLIAELLIPCGKPEVSGETAQEQNSEMLEIAALHRENQK